MKRIKWVIILIFLFAFTERGLSEKSEDIVFSEDVRNRIGKLKNLIKGHIHGDLGEQELTTAYTNYKCTVFSIGELIVANEENFMKQNYDPFDVDYALALMSYEIVKRPEMLTEIFEYYKPSGSRYIVPWLKTKHISVSYKGVWEFLLLAPRTRQIKTVNRPGGEYSNF